MAAYPEARVDLGERGLILRPSRPAIQSLKADCGSQLGPVTATPD
jgi:hypothetical protein